MTGDLVPSDRDSRYLEPRISDTDREQAVEQLRGAIGDGRLTPSEFEERIAHIYQAKTRDDLVRLLADVLPWYADREPLRIKTTSGSFKRKGRWTPPSRIEIEVGSGSVKLDFTEALVAHPTVDITVAVKSGSVTIVMPQGGTAEVDSVEVRSGEVKSKVPAVPSASGPHVRVTGSVRSGSVMVRYQRRFWRWRW